MTSQSPTGLAVPRTGDGGAGTTAIRSAVGRLAVAVVTCSAALIASGVLMARVVTIATGTVWTIVLAAITGLLVLAAASTLRPLVAGVRQQSGGTRARDAGRTVEARTLRHRASRSATTAIGWCLPILLLSAFGLFVAANDHAVQSTFFDVSFMRDSVLDVAAAFRRNILIAVVAEALVLVWGLLVAVARLAPGTAGRPLRWIATAYVDTFRAIPAIIVIYLVGFGLPLAGVPILSDMSPLWAAVLALTLTYGAYVAEVYRAGIESIHPSQVAAARSLGLSHGRTLRFVVVPQAVRRVTPPLLNDFIGLQKDTALVTVIGTVDAFTQAKIYASNYFNLSSVSVVALLFVLITIPQTRFVDRLLARDARRQTAGA